MQSQRDKVTALFVDISVWKESNTLAPYKANCCWQLEHFENRQFNPNRLAKYCLIHNLMTISLHRWFGTKFCWYHMFDAQTPEQLLWRWVWFGAGFNTHFYFLKSSFRYFIFLIFYLQSDELDKLENWQHILWFYITYIPGKFFNKQFLSNFITK